MSAYTYLFVYDVTSPAVNHKALLVYLEDAEYIIDYWNYIPGIFFLKAHIAAPAIGEKLRPFFEDGRARFLVMEVDHLERAGGMLPPAAWDWLNAEYDKRLTHSPTEPPKALLERKNESKGGG